MANPRAESFRAAVRVLGGRRTRRRIPRQLWPSALQREYARFLLSLVERVERSLDPLFRALPGLLASAASERARTDAGEGRKVRELLDEAQRAFEAGLVSAAELDQLLERLAVRVDAWNKKEVGKQVRAAFGVDVFAAEPKLATAIEGFVTENVGLIKTLPSTLFSDIEKLVTRAVNDARPARDVAKEMQERFRVTRNRARLIARDQIGKLNGDINRERQKALGVESYIWRTSNDRRVRGTPGGAFPNAKPSHYDREGKVYRWDEPPSDGHPGFPILCRCFAEPVFQIE